MRTSFPLLVPTVAAFLVAPPRTSPLRDDDALEPPMEFRLLRGEQATPVRLDEPFQLQTEAGPIELVLVVDPLRTFRRDGISFKYPREYVFEADMENPRATVWTLSGNDALLMLTRYPDLMDPEELRDTTAESIQEDYGEDSDVMSVSCTVGSKELSGRRVTMRIGDVLLIQDVYAFNSEEKSYLFILQDSPDDLDTPTEEFSELLDLLSSTMVIAP